MNTLYNSDTAQCVISVHMCVCMGGHGIIIIITSISKGTRLDGSGDWYRNFASTQALRSGQHTEKDTLFLLILVNRDSHT